MMEIKIEKFEGPLGLLLKLIEQEELDITQISLAKIADQYIEYIKNTEKISPDDLAEFLVVAARLLLIKSRALLPFLYPEEEEEIEELEQQLKMYKEFVEASKGVLKMIGKKKFMFVREFNRKAVLASANLFSPPKNLKTEDLRMVFGDLLTRIKPMEKLEEKVLEEKINIEDKILSIQKMIIDRIEISFNKFLENAKTKTEVIVSFLAMLELVKQRDILASQNSLFEDILISKNEKL